MAVEILERAQLHEAIILRRLRLARAGFQRGVGDAVDLFGRFGGKRYQHLRCLLRIRDRLVGELTVLSCVSSMT